MALLKVNDDGTIGVSTQKKKKKKQADLVVGSDGNISFNAEGFRTRLAENEEEEDIAPVVTSTKRSWFEKGLFEDGYDFGDVTKTILGTNRDIAEDLAAGVAGIGEGLLDTGAYIAGGAAKLFGADDVSEKLKSFQERDLVKEYDVANKLVDKLSPGGNLLGITNDLVNKGNTERVSVLGDKTDSLIQSAGQLGGTAALQTVGVPWWMTTGVTSFGSGTEQAFQNDATYGEAGAYGLISAGAEVLTEKLSGGIKFGGKALDEGLKRKLTEGITNKTVNTLTKLGFDMVGEGAEEVLSEVITNIGEKLTFADEKTWNEILTSEEAVEGYIESFIGGAVLGGGFSAGKAYKSAKTGRDYDTGLTKNEQAVVNSEVTNRTTEIQKQRAVKQQIERIVEERERTFGNLSDAEKKSITQQVQSRLEAGEIDFTKTQLDKKEIAKIESEVMEDLRNGYIGIDTIENTLSGEKTARLRELEQTLTNTTNKAKKAEIEAEINQIKGDRANELKSMLSNDIILQESYRQEALKGQEFTREVTEKDSDITKELLESAKASKMNNTRKMHNLFEYTNKIANDTNTKYGFTNNEQLKELGHDVEGKTVNGLVRINEDGSTKVLINVDSEKALNTIIGHETTHLLEGTKEYKALQNIVKEYATTKGEYDGRFKQISKLYDGTNANVENELTADLVGDYLFTDEQFINNLSAKEPNVFKKVYDYIKHAFKMATAGSKEARQLEQVKRRFDKAYKEMSKTTTGKADSNLTTEADSDTRHSLSDSQGRELTKEQQEYFKDSKVRDENGNLLEVYHGTKTTGINIFNYDANRQTGDNFGEAYYFTSDYTKAQGYSYDVDKDPRVRQYKNERAALLKKFLETKSEEDAQAFKNHTVDGKTLADMMNEETYNTGGEVKRVYLNLTNPLIVDADGEYYYKVYDDYFARAREGGNDGIIVKNVIDNPRGEPRPIDVYIAFKPNQIKSVANANPTSDPDIRFSLSAPVEEGKTLMAIRNIGEKELRGMISLGGIPVPSIAITDPSKVDHTNFGPISILFDKETINPANKKNEVYDRDIWSSRFPTINYELDSKKASDLYARTRKVGHVPYFNPVTFEPHNLEDTIDRAGGEAGFVEYYKDDAGIKNFYLAETSSPVAIIKTEKVDEIDPLKAEQFDYILGKMSNELSQIKNMTGKEWNAQYGEQFKQVQKEAWKQIAPMLTDEDLVSLVDNKKPFKQVIFANKVYDYSQNGGRTVTVIEDDAATKQEINSRVNQSEYEAWLRDLFKGIEKSKGIRNDKDTFTPSGNRRSFKQTHDLFTLENIVKNMTKGRTQGSEDGIFGTSAGAISANMATRFNSIEDIKANEYRIDPGADKKVNELKDELYNDIMALKKYYSGYAWDAPDVLTGAVFEFSTKKQLTESGLRKILGEYHIDAKSIENNELKKIIKDLNALKDIPSDYFEAKPQRAVGLDEVQAIVLPNTTDVELKKELTEAGLYIIEYDPNIEGDRQNKINQFDNLKFSLSNPGETRVPVKGYAVYGSDVKLQEDIAPVKETISETEKVEDIAPVREELELSRALTEEDLPYVEQDRADAFNNLPVYEPEEIEYYNEPDTAPLDDKYLKLVAKNMRQELGLKNNQVAGLRKIIQDFSTSEDQSMESLYNAIEAEFGTIYEKQKIEDVTGIKAALRSTRLKVSDTIKTDIPDYAKWRQKQFGTLRIANDGMAVDDVYEGLKDIYPQYFPEDIINPTDQLLKIAEIASMDATVIEEYSLPEEQIQEVADYIYESITEYKQQKRFEAAQTAGKAPIDESMIPYEETILETPIPEDAAPVEKEVEPEEEPETVVEKTKKELRKHLIEDDAGFLIKALDKAKNIPMALMNNTDTIRVSEMVFGRRAGKKINDLIFQKAIDNEARSIAWQNKQRAEIAALGIKARSKESEAVQKYAEKKILTDEGEYITYDDVALARDFKDPEERAKIIGAARALREKYDTYIDVANNVLTNLGFDPIPKRDDYMRHFQELNDVFTRYGIPFNAQNMQEHVLPTDINGLTEFWSPQKNFFASIKPREGMRTTFDAITGIDGYISGIANLIYHTEDIQRGRALEDLVRETYGETSGWDNLEKLPEEEQAARAELIQDNHLSNYAAWLHEWTNNIAGKKNKIDRSIESMFGRKAFSFLDETRKQVGSNMIGLNLSSSLTNLIAPVQAMAKTNKLAVAKGTADTIKNIFVKDDFMKHNSFLTSRMGTEMLSKTAWQKMQDAGFVFMKGMDWFSSNQIVRSKFYELKAQGMTDAEAHTEAGKFAARILGDRTKGANAQLYNSKLVGLVTQFQLEVNNQLYSMFYDTYHESKENAQDNALKTAAGMTFTLGQLFAFTHLFGKTFESLAGYNPTFDVIGILATALGTGDDEEDKPVSERLKEAADKLVDALPYVNILTGGGRIPVTSGIPNLVGVATGGKDDYGNELTWEGELKKLIYLVPPTGGGQIKKTTQGLAMFDSDNPVTGSYTDSGSLRFPVEDTPLNRLQAGVFGQWASGNARNYFDNERKPLGTKQIQEYKDLDLPIADYWKYREDLKDHKTLEDKFNYIADLDLPVSKKNIMINNIVDRKEAVDMTNYDQFASYEEFDWATKNPEKYSYFESIGVSYKQYNSSKEAKKAYNWAYENPEKYSLAKAAAGDVVKYRSYVSGLDDLKADKDSNGKTISGSRKEKVANYINSLDADYGSKLVLFKSEYPADDTYNYEIIEYLNNRQDISYNEMVTILRELDFTVDANGNVTW